MQQNVGFCSFMTSSRCHVCSHENSKESPSWSAYMGKMFSAASTYLPSQVSDMMHQDRAFATVRLSVAGVRNIAALSTWVQCITVYKRMEMRKYLNVYIIVCRIQKVPRLLVASLDGHLYIYNVDPQEGGDCHLVKKHRWASTADYTLVICFKILIICALTFIFSSNLT